MSHLRRMFAIVALALVIAPLAASAPLFDPDEGLHAAIAQEMVQRGDYVTPTFRGEPFLDKPILFFWAEAASLRVLGHNAAAVRIPPLLFGLFGMLAVALLGRALFNEAAGLFAGIVYGTMLLPMGVSEVAVHDVGLVPFMCLAAYGLLVIETTPGGSSMPGVSAVNWGRIGLHAVLAGVALGFSILTKGLVGVVFAGIFGVCLTVRRPAAWFRLGLGLTIAVIVALLVAAPWYVAMEHAHPGYLHYYFVERHLQGYLTATQRHAGRPFWYYLPIVLGGALPWTAYLLGAPQASRRTSLRLVVWGWFVIGLVFLSIGESKLVTYALPLFPALALLIGDYVQDVWSREPVRVREGDPWFTFGLATHAIALALLPALGLAIVFWRFGAVHPRLWVAVAITGLLTLDAARRAAASVSARAFTTHLVGMTIFTLVGLMLVAPRAAAWMTARDLAVAMNAAGELPPRLWVLDERIGSLIFYLDPPLRAQAGAGRVDTASFPEAMMRVRADSPDALFAVRRSQLPRFNRLFPSPPPADAQAGTFSLYRGRTLRAALGDR